LLELGFRQTRMQICRIHWKWAEPIQHSRDWSAQKVVYRLVSTNIVSGLFLIGPILVVSHSHVCSSEIPYFFF
jgi:hypothetical protein